jgi:hypothetical protein
MNYYLDFKLLVLLGMANGVPVFAKDALGPRLSFPLDGGIRFLEGRPLFGPSKTLRGIVLSLSVTTLGATITAMRSNFFLMGFREGDMIFEDHNIFPTAEFRRIDQQSDPPMRVDGGINLRRDYSEVVGF